MPASRTTRVSASPVFFPPPVVAWPGSRHCLREVSVSTCGELSSLEDMLVDGDSLMTAFMWISLGTDVLFISSLRVYSEPLSALSS